MYAPLVKSQDKINWTDVVEKAEARIAEGYAGADLHHQLSEAYFQLGKPGKALLHARKGLVLAPGNTALRHNVEWLRSRQPDKLPPAPEFFLSQWLNELAGWMMPGGWGIMALLLLWGGALGVGAGMLGKLPRRLSAFPRSGWLLIALALAPLTLAQLRHTYLNQHNEAIVTAARASLKVAPDAASPTEKEVSEGLEVKIIDQSEGWYKVALVNGRRGWISARELERI
jgi:hypothetical protein